MVLPLSDIKQIKDHLPNRLLSTSPSKLMIIAIEGLPLEKVNVDARVSHRIFSLGGGGEGGGEGEGEICVESLV